MSSRVFRFVARQVIGAIWLLLLALQSHAAGNWESGKQQYNDPNLCVYCHNADVNLSIIRSGVFYPAVSPAGKSSTYLQGRFNAGATVGSQMGNPKTNSLRKEDGTIHPTVSDIAAYITKPNFPTAVISPSFDFGSVDAHATRTTLILVTNGGDRDLHVTSATLDDNVNYGTTVPSTCASITPSNSCNITVVFQPQSGTPSGATFSNTLTISHDAFGGSSPVSLLGSGFLANAVVTPSPVPAFPATLEGTTSSTSVVVTISNPRRNDISYARPAAIVPSTGTASTEFAVSAESCSTGVVPAGGLCTLTLRFAPQAPAGTGAREATLQLRFTGSGGDAAPTQSDLVLSGVASPPAAVFAISVDSLPFSAAVGTTTTASAVISNLGGTAFTLNTLTFSPTATAPYSLATANACTPGLSVPPLGNCTLVIRFAPTLAGEHPASLEIAHNLASSPKTVFLQGTTRGRIELPQNTVTFQSTALGSTALPQTVVLSHPPGGDPVTFGAFTLSGDSDFERSGTCGPGVQLLAGQQCTVIINFRPSAVGSRNASLSIASDAGNAPTSLTLTGTGEPAPSPVVHLSPLDVPFGTQTVGGIYPTRSVTLKNTGTATLSAIVIAVEGNGYARAGNTFSCSASLAPGASCVIEIVFAPSVPSAPGTSFNGTLRVTSNAVGSPHTALLRGIGSATEVPILTWSPTVSQLDFGQVSAGTISPTQSLTLLNQGPGGAQLRVVNAIGIDSAAFTVSPGTCVIGSTLFENQSCRIEVSFSPGSAGVKSASVQVASTGSLPPVLSLTGTGLAGSSPLLEPSPASLSFPSTQVGAQSLPMDLALRISGAGVLRVTGVAVSGPFVMTNKTCPSVPFTLPAGGDCTVTVTFQPQSEGDAAGVLRVTSDAAPAVREVALSGKGVPAAKVSGGGCSISADNLRADPTLWVLVLLAVAALFYRYRAREARARGLP